MISPTDIKNKFNTLFPGDPIIVRSPGRINLIGEHTDYNDGFVMPAAIDKEVFFAVAKSPDNISKVYSVKYDEYFTVDLDDIKITKKPSWANYLLGVLRKLIDEGYSIKPFHCVFGGNIPLGAGLSSSAALECGFAYAMNVLNNLNIPKQQIIQTGLWAEHNFAGVKCGIMDQFASVMGQTDQVVLLDCRSLEYTYFPLMLNEYSLVLCNSNIKHTLVDTEYNTRRKECEEGVRILRTHYPEIKSLRDASPEMVEKHRAELTGKIYNRCLYITQEIVRVVAASRDLQRGDITSFGAKMYETHRGLTKLYEVSCPELDFLVEFASANKVTGSRMMGGGFGGCTINIIEESAADKFIESACVAYKKTFNIDMTPYRVSVREGTSLVNF